MSSRKPIGEYLKHAWNTFRNRDPTEPVGWQVTNGPSSYIRHDRPSFHAINDQSIVSAIYTKIAIDVSEIKIQHVKKDDNNRYLETVKSGLNECLNVEANIDQTGKSFIQDVVISMFDEGCVAIVPVETSINPLLSSSYEILSMRVGKILEWYPKDVKVQIYNENKGVKEDIIMPKKLIAIIENPFYAIMNRPNGTHKRLTRKINLLDAVDEQSSSGKLDLIIQLPYTIKTESRRQIADARRKDIEMQLSGSKFGVAYIDGTEHITQLNRPIENNLLTQVEYLTNMLRDQLGLTEKVFNGTASEAEMLNYTNRTITPIISAIVDELSRKFLTKTARSKGHSIMPFAEPFKLVTVSAMAEIADKFTRNEILSSNEVRQLIGYKASDDPAADELRNKNLNQSVEKQNNQNESES